MNREQEMHRMVEILNETYLFYVADPSRRGIVEKTGSCQYKTPDGQMCAVGRCMTRPTLNQSGSADMMYSDQNECKAINLEPRLKKQYRHLPILFWVRLQCWHDDYESWQKVKEEGDYSAVYRDFLDLYRQVVTGDCC